MTKRRECKDCRAEGRTGPVLNARFQGPRCYRHHYAHCREVSERSAGRRRQTQYGTPPELYQALLEAQGGGCAICGRKPGKRSLAVDHDHACCPGSTSCGECVRGLLCWTCNKYLHHIGDSPTVAQQAANYLEDPPAYSIALNVQVR